MESDLKEPQSAGHLAARAVMAYRAGFSIDGLAVPGTVTSESGIICDWKQAREHCQSHFTKAFKRQIGVTPKQWQRDRKISTVPEPLPAERTYTGAGIATAFSRRRLSPSQFARPKLGSMNS
jgi:hypothetical protein